MRSSWNASRPRGMGGLTGICPAWTVGAAVAGFTGVETLSLCLGQRVDLLREEPPVRFGRCEVGSTCECGFGGVWSSKPAQQRAACRVHEVIAGQVPCDRVH